MVCSLTDPSAPPIATVNASGSGAQPRTRPYTARQRMPKARKTPGGPGAAGAGGTGGDGSPPDVGGAVGMNGVIMEDRMMDGGDESEEMYVHGQSGPSTSSSRFRLSNVHPQGHSPFPNNLPPPSSPHRRRHHGHPNHSGGSGGGGGGGGGGEVPSPPTSLPPLHSPPASHLKAESPPSYPEVPRGVEGRRSWQHHHSNHSGTATGPGPMTGSASMLAGGGGGMNVSSSSAYVENPLSPRSLGGEARLEPYPSGVRGVPPPLSSNERHDVQGGAISGSGLHGGHELDWRGSERRGEAEGGYRRIATSSVRTGSGGDSDEKERDRDGYHEGVMVVGI